MVYLTFDDGPSTSNTPDVLDILKEENVKATFFIAGENAEGGGESSKKLIKRAFDEGNAIANHSWSHDYKVLYPNRILNLDNFKEDFKKTDEFLKDVLGDNFSTNVLRCPGGYMSWKEMEPLANYLEKSNKSSIDWNALNKDAEGAKKIRIN
ncbi:MAG: polysaccharide deacetylase family protein [Paraclostridium sp.]